MSAMNVIEQELDMQTALFKGITRSCHLKCINSSNYVEADLNKVHKLTVIYNIKKGESVCIDRCVAKYFETFQMVGTKLNPNMQQPK